MKYARWCLLAVWLVVPGIAWASQTVPLAQPFVLDLQEGSQTSCRQVNEVEVGQQRTSVTTTADARVERRDGRKLLISSQRASDGSSSLIHLGINPDGSVGEVIFSEHSNPNLSEKDKAKLEEVMAGMMRMMPFGRAVAQGDRLYRENPAVTMFRTILQASPVPEDGAVPDHRKIKDLGDDIRVVGQVSRDAMDLVSIKGTASAAMGPLTVDFSEETLFDPQTGFVLASRGIGRIKAESAPAMTVSLRVNCKIRRPGEGS